MIDNKVVDAMKVDFISETLVGVLLNYKSEYIKSMMR